MRFFTLLNILIVIVGCGGGPMQTIDPRSRQSSNANGANGATGNELIDFFGSPSFINGGGMQVAVYPQARIDVDYGYNVHLTGAGLRQKVVIITVDIYVLASYIDLQQGINPSNPLSSISQSKAKALVLTLVHDVSASQLQQAFSSNLQNNGIDPNSPQVQQLFQAMNSDFPSGTQVFFASITDNQGIDHLFIQSQSIDTEVDGQGFGTEFWKLWFGNTAGDSNLQQLQMQLVGQ